MDSVRIEKLLCTPALPCNFVALGSDGVLYLMPMGPMAPSSWGMRTPYRGNYTLEPVMPQSLIGFYDPNPEVQTLEPEKLLRVGEAATLAGCSDTAIRDAADAGELPVSAVIGRRRERRFRRDDVLAWIQRRRP